MKTETNPAKPGPDDTPRPGVLRRIGRGSWTGAKFFLLAYSPFRLFKNGFENARGYRDLHMGAFLDGVRANLQHNRPLPPPVIDEAGNEVASVPEPAKFEAVTERFGLTEADLKRISAALLFRCRLAYGCMLVGIVLLLWNAWCERFGGILMSVSEISLTLFWTVRFAFQLEQLRSQSFDEGFLAFVARRNLLLFWPPA